MHAVGMSHAYAVYLNSPEWGEKRKEALKLANHRCRCGETETLEVHHLSYERLGFERQRDLVVLCNSCHAKEHGRSPKGQPIAGMTPAERAARAYDNYWQSRDQEERLAASVTRSQREAINTVRDAVFDLADGPLRKRLRRFLADNHHLVYVCSQERLLEQELGTRFREHDVVASGVARE